jgi:hypothetical protein
MTTVRRRTVGGRAQRRTRLSGLERPRRRARGTLARASSALALLAAATLATGCGTVHPPPLGGAGLAEAQTFPYFRLYWAGPSFIGKPLAAVDGMRSYSTAIGDSVYYGDCVNGKGLLGGGGSCLLPLQVTTVIYRLHSNSALGPQRNVLVRGVPATIYDEGHSMEIYSGRLAIDVSSDSLAHALFAASELRPLNAPGSAGGRLPPPVYCPGLSGYVPPKLQRAMSLLPGSPCQKAQAAIAAAEQLAEAGVVSR